MRAINPEYEEQVKELLFTALEYGQCLENFNKHPSEINGDALKIRENRLHIAARSLQLAAMPRKRKGKK